MPTEDDYNKLSSAWYSFLRQMSPGGRARKPKKDNTSGFALKYTNKNLETYFKTPPIRDFMHVQFLNYIAHIVRRNTDHPTKQALFIKAGNGNAHNVWRKVTFPLGITKFDAILKMKK